MKARLPKFKLAMILIAELAGCAKPVNSSDLPGTYVAEYPSVRDTLVLKADGTFTQQITLKPRGNAATNWGTWRFDPGDKTISLSEEFVAVVDGFNQMVTNLNRPKNAGISILPVRHRSGIIEIGGDDSLWGRTGAETPHRRAAPEKTVKQ
jgi:hypothetical protein